MLDEFSSSLDSVTEASVHEAINILAHQRTVLVVAHRLSTIRNAHQILVLDAGQIVEHGGFDQLVEKNGVFAAMWQKQLSAEDEA